MKKIKFIPENDYVLHNIVPPLPAKNFVPEWYRNGEYYLSKKTGEIVSKNDKDAEGGMKSCAPFLDSMISGYFIVTWADIEVTKNDGENFEWRYVQKNPYSEEYEEMQMPIRMINERVGKIGHTIPRPHGYSKNHLVFNGQWGIRTPRNWSIWFCHPQNRFDLPFHTTSGFADSDEFWNNGNIPFFIQKDWAGIIPKNTPIAQLIPIKRESWTSYVYKSGMERAEEVSFKARERIGYYKSRIWVRKEYN